MTNEQPTISPFEEASIPDVGERKTWGAWTGILVWLSSIALIFGAQIIAVIVYFFIRYRETGRVPKTFVLDWLVTILSIVSTFPAHILTLAVCWLVVTARGKRSFRQTLGWSWHPQFRWVHAVALAFLMLGVTFLFERFLPHKETDLEKILKMGMAMRVTVAALAVLTAPLVEEIVYRGVLFAGIARAWGQTAAIVLVTFFFAIVHVPQYWGSVAAIAAIVTLSLVLTLLRASTGRLLPCVATHLVYNSIQAIMLLGAPDKLPEASPTKTAIAIFTQWLGLG